VKERDHYEHPDRDHDTDAGFYRYSVYVYIHPPHNINQFLDSVNTKTNPPIP
jgi:hypothetical protein